MCVKDATFLIAFVPLLICLVILSVIAIALVKQLKLDEHTQKPIKIVYIIACMCSIVATTINLIYSTGCVDSFRYSPLLAIFVGAYYCVLVSVLLTLLLRLHYTFKESMFRMKSYQKWIIIIISLCGLILALIYLITLTINVHAHYVIGSLGLIYFGLSLYGMCLFSSKMYTLTKMRKSSMVDVENANDTKTFNKHQGKLLYMTTKYVTLLSIAMISTWMNIFIFLTVHDADTTGVLMCIDCVINVICLYLQYPCNREYYDKYCICFGNCCIYLLVNCGKTGNLTSDGKALSFGIGQTPTPVKDETVDKDGNVQVSHKPVASETMDENAANEQQQFVE